MLWRGETEAQSITRLALDGSGGNRAVAQQFEARTHAPSLILIRVSLLGSGVLNFLHCRKKLPRGPIRLCTCTLPLRLEAGKVLIPATPLVLEGTPDTPAITGLPGGH